LSFAFEDAFEYALKEICGTVNPGALLITGGRPFSEIATLAVPDGAASMWDFLLGAGTPLLCLLRFLPSFSAILGVCVVEYLSRQTASNAPALQRKFLSQAESKPASPKVASADHPP
jgi:hypothetical protein